MVSPTTKNRIARNGKRISIFACRDFPEIAYQYLFDYGFDNHARKESEKDREKDEDDEEDRDDDVFLNYMSGILKETNTKDIMDWSVIAVDLDSECLVGVAIGQMFLMYPKEPDEKNEDSGRQDYYVDDDAKNRETLDNVVSLSLLRIRKQNRKERLGSFLMDAWLQNASDHASDNCRALCLECVQDLVPFYSRYGFKPQYSWCPQYKMVLPFDSPLHKSSFPSGVSTVINSGHVSQGSNSVIYNFLVLQRLKSGTFLFRHSKCRGGQPSCLVNGVVCSIANPFFVIGK